MQPNYLCVRADGEMRSRVCRTLDGALRAAAKLYAAKGINDTVNVRIVWREERGLGIHRETIGSYGMTGFRPQPEDAF